MHLKIKAALTLYITRLMLPLMDDTGKEIESDPL